MAESNGILVEQLPENTTKTELQQLFEQACQASGEQCKVEYILFPLAADSKKAFVNFSSRSDMMFKSTLRIRGNPIAVEPAPLQMYSSCTADVDPVVVASIPDIADSITHFKEEFGISAEQSTSGQFVLSGSVAQLQCAEDWLRNVFEEQQELQKIQLRRIGWMAGTRENSTSDTPAGRDVHCMRTDHDNCHHHHHHSWGQCGNCGGVPSWTANCGHDCQGHGTMDPTRLHASYYGRPPASEAGIENRDHHRMQSGSHLLPGCGCGHATHHVCQHTCGHTVDSACHHTHHHVHADADDPVTYQRTFSPTHSSTGSRPYAAMNTSWEDMSRGLEPMRTFDASGGYGPVDQQQNVKNSFEKQANDVVSLSKKGTFLAEDSDELARIQGTGVSSAASNSGLDSQSQLTESTKGSSVPPKTTCDLDYYVVEYLMRSEQSRLTEIEQKFGVTIKAICRVCEDIMTVAFQRYNPVIAEEQEERAKQMFLSLYQSVYQNIVLRKVSVPAHCGLDATQYVGIIQNAIKDKIFVTADDSNSLTLVGPFTEVSNIETFLQKAVQKSQVGNKQGSRRVNTSGDDQAADPEGRVLVGKKLEDGSSEFEYKCHDKFLVKVYTADIAELSVDVIVNAANQQLLNYAGVAGAIESAGGDELREDCRKIIEESGPLKVTEVVHTAGRGQLKCHYVVHTVGPTWLGDRSRCTELLQKTFENVLHYSSRVLHATSVAVPPISTGIYDVPLDVCAQSLHSAIEVIADKASDLSLKEIHLVNKDPQLTEVIQTIFQHLLSASQDAAVTTEQTRLPEVPASPCHQDSPLTDDDKDEEKVLSNELNEDEEESPCANERESSDRSTVLAIEQEHSHRQLKNRHNNLGEHGEPLCVYERDVKEEDSDSKQKKSRSHIDEMPHQGNAMKSVAPADSGQVFQLQRQVSESPVIQKWLANEFHSLQPAADREIEFTHDGLQSEDGPCSMPTDVNTTSYQPDDVSEDGSKSNSDLQ